MIQIQMLNYIITNKDVELLTTFDEKYYPSYKDEYNFIKNHYKSYKNIPDIHTIIEKFEEFPVLDVRETKEYLMDKLVEDYQFEASYKIIKDSEDIFNEDARKAIDFIRKGLDGIQTPSTKNIGVDIIKNVQSRYDKFLERYNNVDSDKDHFSTGLKELDILFNKVGLRRGEELVVIYARTNNAKTWLAEKMAVSVWAEGDGHNVGFFSPEMSPDEIGYRFDTLFMHFQNNGFNGNNPDFNADKYSSYTKKLAKKDKIFNVTSPVDPFFNRQASVSKLKNWIEELKLEFIVIDGLTYLYDERSDNKAKETDRLTNISEDLMSLSMEMKIPILIVLQANRTAARDNEGNVNDDTPELDTIRNSDGISHNVSKAIALRLKDNIMSLKITKDRYGGAVGCKLTYNVDLNTGKFTYLPNPKAHLPEEENEKIAEEQRSSYEDSEELF